MPSPISSVWPGKPFPQGATWDGQGVNFALFSEHAERRRAVPVRRPRPSRAAAHPDARADGSGLALLSARGAARAVVRLPRAWSVSAAARASLQPAQAAARSVCQGDRRLAGVERCAFRLSHRQPARRPVAGPAQQRERHAEMPGHRSRVLVGRGSQAATRRGTTPSSTRCTCAASPSFIRRCRRSIAARTPGSARRRSSSICSVSASRRSS